MSYFTRYRPSAGLLDNREERSRVRADWPHAGFVPARAGQIPDRTSRSGNEDDLIPPAVLALYREALDADGLDFLTHGPRSPEERLAFAQRVHPQAHRAAEPLPEADQRRFRERGAVDEGSAFLGPDGIVYRRGEDSGEGLAARIRRGFENAVGGYERPNLQQLFAEIDWQVAEGPQAVETGAQPAGAEANEPFVFDIGPPTSEIVDTDAMQRGLRFDPSGPGQLRTALGMPLDALRAMRLRYRDVEEAVERHFPDITVAHDNDADAFRHALWSFLVTREMGTEAAKSFGDAHERYDERQKQGSQLMDLFNNNVGRRLALDPRNKDRSAEEVILEALRNGQLQTRSFRLPGPSAPEPQWPGIFLGGPYMNRNGM
jgi:hypothetical protein